MTQLVSDNPGVWPFHCHIVSDYSSFERTAIADVLFLQAWHVGQGLYVNVIQKPELIAQRTEIPVIMEQSCGREYLTPNTFFLRY